MQLFVSFQVDFPPQNIYQNGFQYVCVSLSLAIILILDSAPCRQQEKRQCSCDGAAPALALRAGHAGARVPRGRRALNIGEGGQLEQAAARGWLVSEEIVSHNSTRR